MCVATAVSAADLHLKILPITDQAGLSNNCKRNSVAQLRDLGTFGIDNSGYEHDRGMRGNIVYHYIRRSDDWLVCINERAPSTQWRPFPTGGLARP